MSLERFNQNCGRGGSAGFSPLQRDIYLAALKRRERRAPNDPEPGCKSGHDIFENALMNSPNEKIEPRHLVSYKGSPQFFRLDRVDVAGRDAVS